MRILAAEHRSPTRTAPWVAKPAAARNEASALHRHQLSIQPKLRINRPGDEYEQEADRVADRVMRLPGPGVQRKCACGGTCSECSGGHADEEHGLLQMKPADAHATDRAAAPPGAIEALKEPGDPLQAALREEMENRFGHHFGHVRVHASGAAAFSAATMDAQAYTSGHHVVFAQGRYAPSTNAGKHLLAHELTHVLQQQGAGPEGTVQRAPAKGAKTRQQLDQEMIGRTRTQAMGRLSRANLRINGTNPHFNENEELQVVQGLISPRIENLEQVAELLGRMLSIVTSSKIEVGPEIKECSQWVGYVLDNQVPIHLCRKFFSKGDEEGTRTLIHESAHAIGIGKPGAEGYFPIYDCSPGTTDNWATADAWSRYVHCISGATPDKPDAGP